MRGLSRAESAYGGSGVNPVTATSGCSRTAAEGEPISRTPHVSKPSELSSICCPSGVRSAAWFHERPRAGLGRLHSFGMR